MINSADEGGLGWGTLWGSLALFALPAVMVAYQAIQVRHHPLGPLPYPLNRHNGEPQHPHGAGQLRAGSPPEEAPDALTREFPASLMTPHQIPGRSAHPHLP